MFDESPLAAVGSHFTLCWNRVKVDSYTMTQNMHDRLPIVGIKKIYIHFISFKLSSLRNWWRSGHSILPLDVWLIEKKLVPLHKASRFKFSRFTNVFGCNLHVFSGFVARKLIFINSIRIPFSTLFTLCASFISRGYVPCKIWSCKYTCDMMITHCHEGFRVTDERTDERTETDHIIRLCSTLEPLKIDYSSSVWLHETDVDCDDSFETEDELQGPNRNNRTRCCACNTRRRCPHVTVV